jgi:predicted Holliday junction resolvase-like endonuclease
MPDWARIAVSLGGAVVVWTGVAIIWIQLARDRRIEDRERRHRALERRIDERHRELQRQVQNEIRREIRNELRYELRHEIRREFENVERRLGGRIDAVNRRRLETSGAGRGQPEYGGRLSEWVARLPPSD